MDDRGGSGDDSRPPQAVDAGHAPDSEDTGVTLELLDRLRPYLAESLMVLDHDWSVRVNLAPPGGLIGRGLGLGVHTLEDMHPDDAVQVMELGAQAFTTSPGWQGSKLVRMRRGDGTYGRYEITAINLFDDPVVAGMVVRTREVPADLVDDLNGLQSGSAIETVAELLPLGLLLLDARGRVVFANQAVCALTDRDPEELKRSGLAAVVQQGDRDQIEGVIDRMVAGPGHEEHTVRLAVGRVDRVQCRFSTEGTDQVTRIMVTLEDVTERHAERQDLEQRANHDALTGLRNRASIHDLIYRRIAAEVPTLVAYVDLDGFKAVNDTWGHDRGDHLLIALAKAFRSGLAAGAEIARIGGDEFVVVLDDHGCTETDLIDQLATLISGVTRSEDLTVTGSIGTARTTPGDTPREVVGRADQAMYSVKARRRR